MGATTGVFVVVQGVDSVGAAEEVEEGSSPAEGEGDTGAMSGVSLGLRVLGFFPFLAGGAVGAEPGPPVIVMVVVDRGGCSFSCPSPAGGVGCAPGPANDADEDVNSGTSPTGGALEVSAGSLTVVVVNPSVNVVVRRCVIVTVGLSCLVGAAPGSPTNEAEEDVNTGTSPPSAGLVRVTTTSATDVLVAITVSLSSVGLSSWPS